MAMKKRPSNVPISTMSPEMTSSLCRRITWPQIAAEKRDDMPAHARVILREIAVDGSVTAGDIDHRTPLYHFWNTKNAPSAINAKPTA